MRVALIRVVVAFFGLLCAACIVGWIGSYMEGYFICEFSPGAPGYSFLSVQRGTLAFCLDGPQTGVPSNQYSWWLEPHQMFDAKHSAELNLPGNARVKLGTEVYPWNWQFRAGFEGYFPIWVLAILFSIVPVSWALGFLDIEESKLPDNNTISADRESGEPRTGEASES